MCASAEFLERFGVVRVLKYLINHPEGIRKINYRRELQLSSTTAEDINRLLFDNGIIEASQYPEKQFFRLTNAGRKIAQKIKEIDEILSKDKQ